MWRHWDGHCKKMANKKMVLLKFLTFKITLLPKKMAKFSNEGVSGKKMQNAPLNVANKMRNNRGPSIGPTYCGPSVFQAMLKKRLGSEE